MQLDKLEDGTKYTITVCAQCSIGDGETSTIEASTVLAIPPSGLVTPSLVNASWETLTVEWQPPEHTNGAPVTGARHTALTVALSARHTALTVVLSAGHTALTAALSARHTAH